MTSLTSVHSHTLATSFDIEGSSQASQLLRKMLSKAGLLYLILHDIRFDCSSTQTGISQINHTLLLTDTAQVYSFWIIVYLLQHISTPTKVK